MVSLEYRRRVDKRVAGTTTGTARVDAGRRAVPECIGASRAIEIVAGPGATETPEVVEADDVVHKAEREFNAYGAAAKAERVEGSTEI